MTLSQGTLICNYFFKMNSMTRNIYQLLKVLKLLHICLNGCDDTETILEIHFTGPPRSKFSFPHNSVRCLSLSRWYCRDLRSVTWLQMQ